MDTRSRQNLCLPIERTVICVLRHGHLGSAPSISQGRAGAWVTPSVHVRQAYFGRIVTMTRSCAGTMSNRSVRSSPILCICPQPHGHSRLSGSTISSIRGRPSGRFPRLRVTGTCLSRDAEGVARASSAAASHSSIAIVRSSNASCRSSSVSVSDFLPCSAWRSSFPFGTLLRNALPGDGSALPDACSLPPAHRRAAASPQRRCGARAVACRDQDCPGLATWPDYIAGALISDAQKKARFTLPQPAPEPFVHKRGANPGLQTMPQTAPSRAASLRR